MASFLYNLILEATDRNYPDIVHFPHAVLSLVAYRQWRKAEDQPVQWLHDLVLSYWSHSMAGGCIGKGMLLGHQTFAFMTDPKQLKFHLTAYLLAYWSPRNIAYRALSQPLNPLRLFCVTMDSIDANTTVCGLVDLARKLHPNNHLLPCIVGVFAYQTGALVRWIDAKFRGKDAKSLLLEPGCGVTKSSLIALLWWYLGVGKNRDRNLAAFVCSLGVLDLTEELFGVDAFEVVHTPVVPVLKALQKNFSLGVSPTSEAPQKSKCSEGAPRNV